MIVLRDLEQARGRFRRPFLTLGTFDGVHRGHQEILRRLVESARAAQGDAVALTFYPHPAAVLSASGPPPYLTSLRARIELLAASGVDAVVAQHFTPRFATIVGDDFVRDILVASVGVAGVVVGHRVAFGHRRSGTSESLRRLGAALGFSVEVIGPVEVAGTLVSSSEVRARIADGDLDGARLLLGRWPATYGRVRRGHQRGREIGFPTANLPVAGTASPPDGVYATWTQVRGEWFESVSNLGRNPTFGDTERGLEVHLLDGSPFLYGQRLEVRFVRRLRDEIKFADAQALGAQIGRDVAAARACLAAAPPE